MQTACIPLEIDLRGMTVNEVTEALKENGYRILGVSDVTDLWRQWSILNTEPNYYKNAMVTCVMISEEDAPSLTIVIWDGSRHTLRPGHDLHHFVIGGVSADWGWARTSYLSK